MKKIIISLAILGVVFLAPVAKADEVMLGDAYTTQIAPMEQIAQLQAKLIELITQLIGILQQQLNTINAQNNAPAPVQPTTAQPAPAGIEAPAQNTMTPFEFNPQVLNTGSDLVVAIAEKFDHCALIITDANGRKVREQDTWMTDSQGNARQVYTVSTEGEHSYSITCSKAGFEDNTKTGKFPAAQ